MTTPAQQAVHDRARALTDRLERLAPTAHQLIPPFVTAALARLVADSDSVVEYDVESLEPRSGTVWLYRRTACVHAQWSNHAPDVPEHGSVTIEVRPWPRLRSVSQTSRPPGDHDDVPAGALRLTFDDDTTMSIPLTSRTDGLDYHGRILSLFDL